MNVFCLSCFLVTLLRAKIGWKNTKKEDIWSQRDKACEGQNKRSAMQVVVYEVHPDEGYKAEVSYEGTARVKH